MDSTGSSADATQATAADTQASDPWEVAFPADAIGVEESGGSGGPPAPEEHVMVSQEGDVGGPPESEVAALAPTGCSGGCGTSAADDEDMWFAAADIPRPISPPAVFGETADYAMTTGGSGGSSTPAPAEGAGDMGGISGPVLSPSSGTGDGLGFTNPITEETGDSSGIAQLIPHGGGHGGSGEPGPWEMEWASAPEEAVASTATAPGESSDIQLELPQPSATTSDFVAMFENAAEPGEPMADLTSPATGATASNEVEDDSANAGTAWSAAFGNDALEGESGGSGSPMPDSGTGDVGGISGPSVSPACETGAGPGDVGGISSSAADWPSQPGESAGSIRGAESGDVGGISDAAIDWPSQPGEGAGPVHGIESGAGSGEPGFWEGEASADGARDADFDFSSAPAAAVTASPSPNAAGGLDGMVFDGEFQEEPVEPVAETGQAAVEDFGDFGSFDGPGASVDASPPAAQEEAPQPAQSFADFAADFAADFQPAAAPESNETFGGSSASAAPAGQDPPKASAFNFGDESSDEGPGDVGGISTSADWPSQPGESKGTAVGPETGDVGGISDSAIDWPSPPGESPGNAHGVASGAGSGEPGFWEGEAKDSSPKDDDFDFSSAPPVADVDLDAAAPAVSPSPSPTAGEGFDAVVLESDFQAEGKGATGQPDAEDDFGDFEAFEGPGAAAEAEASPPAAQEEKAPQLSDDFDAEFEDFQPAAPPPETNETFGGSSASAAPAGPPAPKASDFKFGDESSEEGESGGAARSTEVAAAASPAEPAPAQAQDDDDDFFDDDDFEFSSAPTAAAEPPPVSEPVASAERGFNDVQFDGDLSSSTRRLLERWCSDVAQTGKCPLLQKCSPSSADPVSDLEDALRLCIPPATLQLITTGSEFYGKVSGIAAGTPCRFSDAVWEDSCAISCTGAVKAVYMTTLGRFMQITKGAPEQDGDAVGGASAGPVSQSDGLDVDILGADRSQAAASVHPSGPSAAPRGELGGMDADWSIFAAPASQDAGAGGASTSAMDFAGFQAPVPAPTAPAPPASAAASDPLFMFGLAEPPAPSAPPSGAEDGMTDRVRAYLKSLPNLAHLSATTIVAS